MFGDDFEEEEKDKDRDVIGKEVFHDVVMMSLLFASIANHTVLPIAIVYWVFGYQIKKWF